MKDIDYIKKFGTIDDLGKYRMLETDIMKMFDFMTDEIIRLVNTGVLKTPGSLRGEIFIISNKCNKIAKILKSNRNHAVFYSGALSKYIDSVCPEIFSLAGLTESDYQHTLPFL